MCSRLIFIVVVVKGTRRRDECIQMECALARVAYYRELYTCRRVREQGGLLLRCSLEWLYTVAYTVKKGFNNFRRFPLGPIATAPPHFVIFEYNIYIGIYYIGTH